MDSEGEGVLLVTAHVGIAHEVQDVFVGARSWSREIQFHFHFRLQSQSLDGGKTGGEESNIFH